MDESREKRIVAISFIMGFLAAFPFMAAAALVYLRYGDLPVATADKSSRCQRDFRRGKLSTKSVRV